MRRENRPAPAGGFLLACVLATVTPSAMAGDMTAATIAKVGVCVACHGADGIGKAPQYPNLAGQKATYLEKQLKAFRAGERQDPNMSAMAKPLSDGDIADLAAYFESIN